MENNNLIKSILLEIEKNPNNNDKQIYIVGFDYGRVIFPKLLSLYKEGMFFASPHKDESGEIVQLSVGKLTAKGKRYLQSLS